ncbi:MAG: hypothetical protein ABEJ27_05285 [Halodesulfurarchaeum sp.]
MRKPDNPLDNPTRRQYVEAILAASVVGAAGCSEANTTTSQQDTTEEELTIRTPEQDTETATATDTTEGEETTTTEETPTGPPMSERLTVTHTNIPAQSDVNKWQTGDNSAGDRWMYELMGAKDIAGNLYLSGHSWDSPWIEEFDEITIPTVIEDYRLEPPFDYYLSFDDRFTYWDGSTSLDAQAELYDRYMYYAMGGNVFNETATFNNQTLSQYELHSWRDKGNVGGQAPDPTNELILRNDAALEIHPENSAPFHPAYTEPYVQQFRDASTTDAANTIMQQVEGDVVDFFRLAEEGWGSGPYQFESPDDISSSNAVLSLRDDHPNEHIQIPELEILWAEGSRQQVIENQGDIDMNNGVVTDSSGPINRQTLPDYIQEVDRWFSTVGQQMIFNFNNKHLKRLWVRRAIAAAVDWEQTAINGASPDTVETISSQTGLLSTMNRSTFSEEFLNSLSNYPMGADTDLATEYMQRAGIPSRAARGSARTATRRRSSTFSLPQWPVRSSGPRRSRRTSTTSGSALTSKAWTGTPSRTTSRTSCPTGTRLNCGRTGRTSGTSTGRTDSGGRIRWSPATPTTRPSGRLTRKPPATRPTTRTTTTVDHSRFRYPRNPGHSKRRRGQLSLPTCRTACLSTWRISSTNSAVRT